MKVNLNQELNKDTVQLLYSEYKPYLAPILAIVASVLLIIFFLLPQFLSISQKKDTASNENDKLTELVAAKSLAASTDVAQLSLDLSRVNSALPPTKDFESILNTLSTVAAQSNTSIQSYQFQNSPNPNSGLQNFPSLSFNVLLLANPSQTMDFISKLREKTPLSEVESITQSENVSTLSISFFYKPFSPVVESENIKIRKMSSSEANALNIISGWDITTFELGNLPQATESAQENGSPF